MIKDELKKYEPKIYKILENALKNDKVSHLYLLAGPANPLKLDTAYLLAQSIIEDKGEYACEVCDTCRRIKEGIYYDMVFVDGSEEKIDKKDIEDLYGRLDKTALEKANKQVYIINALENNTGAKVENMILKRIEEPHPDLYAIIVTDHFEMILKTIVSRAQVISFKNVDNSYIYDHLIESGYDKLDAYLISEIGIKSEEDDNYKKAKDIVLKTLDRLDDPGSIEIMYQKEVFAPFKGDNDNFKVFLKYYLKLLSIYISSAMDIDTDIEEFKMTLFKIKDHKLALILEAVLDILHKSDYNYDKRSLLDQLAYRLVMIEKGESKNGRDTH